MTLCLHYGDKNESEVSVIVLAGVAVSEGRFLIARRLMSKSNGGMWEFPGGKLEPGESDQEALVREFEEEFSVGIRVNESIGEFPYVSSALSLTLRVYLIDIVSDDFVLVDHSAVEWVELSKLSDYIFSPADIPVVEYLQKMKIGSC